MLSDESLRGLATRLVEVGGIDAVVLGGSRARGEHTAASDVDLGLYYRPPLDVVALGQLASEVAGRGATVTSPGEWGPWVDGGAWLRIGGTPVDWLYRDVDRVHRSWREARAGHVNWHFQVGHPLGVPSFAYAGEAALAVVLADTSGEVTRLHEAARAYPPRLRDAMVGNLREAGFVLAGASKAAQRGDSAYVAGCAFRAVLLCAHAVHAQAGRWVVNEKGAVPSAGRLPTAPTGFAVRAQAVFDSIGAEPRMLAVAVELARALLDDTLLACSP